MESTRSRGIAGSRIEQLPFRLIHLSDVHFWHISLNPLRLMGKRSLGMLNLILNRARKFDLKAAQPLFERIRHLQPDHLLFTGDLTTTSLEEEFQKSRAFLAEFPVDAESATIIPGNHDCYTRDSVRKRLFEKYYPISRPADKPLWEKRIHPKVTILGLEVCRANPITARGFISPEQSRGLAGQIKKEIEAGRRPIVACHYPAFIPPGVTQSWNHGLSGGHFLRSILSSHRGVLYCHGHVHTPWAFTPVAAPGVLCLNPGAALKRSPSGEIGRFLEVALGAREVVVHRHFRLQDRWESVVIWRSSSF